MFWLVLGSLRMVLGVVLGCFGCSTLFLIVSGSFWWFLFWAALNYVGRFGLYLVALNCVGLFDIVLGCFGLFRGILGCCWLL